MWQRIVIIVAIVLVVPLTTRADSSPRGNDDRASGKVAVGGGVALNISKLGGDDANIDEDRSTNKIGFAAGVSIGTRIHEYLKLETGILYTTKGTRVEDSGEDIGVLHFSYLQVPLLSYVEVPMAGRIRPYGVLGPEIGFLLDAEARANNGTTADWTNIAKPVDVGLIVGAGVAVELTDRNTFVFDIRYDFGLMSIDDLRPDGDLRNRAVYFTAGYRYIVF